MDMSVLDAGVDGMVKTNDAGARMHIDEFALDALPFTRQISAFDIGQNVLPPITWRIWNK